MTFDPVLLSRLKFAWVIGWHILLPAFTVGCASFIALLEGLNVCRPRRFPCGSAVSTMAPITFGRWRMPG